MGVQKYFFASGRRVP